MPAACAAWFAAPRRHVRPGNARDRELADELRESSPNSTSTRTFARGMLALKKRVVNAHDLPTAAWRQTKEHLSGAKGPSDDRKHCCKNCRFGGTHAARGILALLPSPSSLWR